MSLLMQMASFGLGTNEKPGNEATFVRSADIASGLDLPAVLLNMALFQFNFCIEDKEDASDSVDMQCTARDIEEQLTQVDEQEPRRFIAAAACPATDTLPQCREIPFIPPFPSVDPIVPTRYMIPGSEVELQYMSAANLKDLDFQDAPDLEAKSLNPGSELDTLLGLVEEKHTDLIPGVYEGGFKVWECAFDLLDYLAKSGMDLSGKKVLELGCGAGLPGLFAMKSGAECVHFQDYNPEVLRLMTIPNVLLNVSRSGHWNQTKDGTGDQHDPETSHNHGIKTGDHHGIGTGRCCETETESSNLPTNCRFFSGGWSEVISLLKCSKYDLILSSETIYSPDSQPALLRALKELICPASGRVLLAAKSYYFGVGGSVQAFQDLVKEDGYFAISMCRTVGSGIPRVILELTPNVSVL